MRAGWSAQESASRCRYIGGKRKPKEEYCSHSGGRCGRCLYRAAPLDGFLEALINLSRRLLVGGVYSYPQDFWVDG